MTSNTFSWKTNEALPTGKGAALQEFSTRAGSHNLEISVAPWGEGRLKVNGREIVHINDAKDRRQAFRILENIADIYEKNGLPVPGVGGFFSRLVDKL